MWQLSRVTIAGTRLVCSQLRGILWYRLEDPSCLPQHATEVDLERRVPGFLPQRSFGRKVNVGRYNILTKTSGPLKSIENDKIITSSDNALRLNVLVASHDLHTPHVHSSQSQ